MEVTSPMELGALLRLEQGLSGGRAELLTRQEIVDFGFEKLQAIKDLPAQDSRDYWSTFGALFLPSFLRTFVHNPLSYEQGAYVVPQFYVEWFKSVVRTPAFARFVRLHPETARELCISFLDLFASINPEWLMARPPDIRPPFLRTMLSACMLLYATLAAHVETDFHLAPMLPATLHRLRSLIPLIVSEVQDLEATGFMQALHQKLEAGGIITHQPHSAEVLQGRYWVWWVCEAQRGELDNTTTEVVSCKASDDREMAMCGQCESVRYCSRAHQRADWKKRHKAVCMKPSW